MYLIEKSNIFDKWLLKLKDYRAKAKILTQIKRMELGNLGDHKSLGSGIYEIRIDYGPGYRLYYSKIEASIILLLVGGDKSSQLSDIQKAKQMLKELEGKNGD